MKRIVMSLFLLVLAPLCDFGVAAAEDAPPAPSAAETTAASTETAATAAVEAAAVVPAQAPAAVAPVAAAEETLTPLDNLDFASGEVVSFDSGLGALSVKVYLDGAGDAKEQTLSLTIDDKTEITNGDEDLKSDVLKAGAEIDVEYDTTNNKATYIFIY